MRLLVLVITVCVAPLISGMRTVPNPTTTGRSLLQVADSVSIPTTVSPGTGPWLLSATRNATTKLLVESASKQGAAINGSVAGQYVAAANFSGKEVFQRHFQLGPDVPKIVKKESPGRSGDDEYLTMENTTFLGVQTAYAYMTGRRMNGTCPDIQAAACPDVPVELRLSFFPDPSPFLNASMVADATGAAGDVASGLVFADVNAKSVDKAEDGTETFAADKGGVAYGVFFLPFNRPVNASNVQVRCLRSVKGRLLPLDKFSALDKDEGIAEMLNSTMWKPYGAAIVPVRMPGAYVLPTYPALPAVSPTAAQLNDTAAVISWVYKFQADWQALASKTRTVARDWVELSVANATGLPGAAINLKALRKGSVVAEVDVWVPRSYTPAQLEGVKASLGNATAVFDMAGAPNGLTFTGGVTGRDPTLKTAAPSSTTIGIAVGVAVGGTVLLAGVIAGVVVMRRRRQAVQP